LVASELARWSVMRGATHLSTSVVSTHAEIGLNRVSDIVGRDFSYPTGSASLNICKNI